MSKLLCSFKQLQERWNYNVSGGSRLDIFPPCEVRKGDGGERGGKRRDRCLSRSIVSRSIDRDVLAFVVRLEGSREGNGDGNDEERRAKQDDAHITVLFLPF